MATTPLELALRAKYSSPAAVMHRLGLDAMLLDPAESKGTEMRYSQRGEDRRDSRRSSRDRDPYRWSERHSDDRSDQQRRIRRALDDESPEDVAAELCAFLAGKIDDDDLETVTDALDRWSRLAADDPPDFPGKPIPGGRQVPLATDPLERGSSREAFSNNVREMMRSGHPQNQSVAAAYREAGEDRRGRRKVIEDRGRDVRHQAMDSALQIETDTPRNLVYLDGYPIHGTYCGRKYVHGIEV